MLSATTTGTLAPVIARASASIGNGRTTDDGTSLLHTVSISSHKGVTMSFTFTEVQPRVFSKIGALVLATLRNGHDAVYLVASDVPAAIAEAFIEHVTSINPDAPVMESDVDFTRTASNVRNYARKTNSNVRLVPIKSDETGVGYRVVLAS